MRVVKKSLSDTDSRGIFYHEKPLGYIPFSNRTGLNPKFLKKLSSKF